MKTPQQIFNKVWHYFIRDKHPKSMTDTSGCLYRGPKSNCAVGCQLPNYLYVQAMENRTVTQLFDSFPKVASYFGEQNERLLGALQNAHDEDFDMLSEALTNIAQQFGLKIPKK